MPMSTFSLVTEQIVPLWLFAVGFRLTISLGLLIINGLGSSGHLTHTAMLCDYCRLSSVVLKIGLYMGIICTVFGVNVSLGFGLA